MIEDQKKIFGDQSWNLISICSSENERIATPKNLSILHDKMNCLDVLPLVFGDFSYENYMTFKDVYDREGKILFNEGHASRIIDFVDRVNERKEPERLVVHCDAGISRSGAVATFVCDYLGFNYRLFLEKNRGINPNSYILDLLRMISGMKISEANSIFR